MIHADVVVALLGVVHNTAAALVRGLVTCGVLHELSKKKRTLVTGLENICLFL